MTERDSRQENKSVTSKTIVWLGTITVFIIIAGTVLLNLKKAPQPEPVEVVEVKPEPVTPPSPPVSVTPPVSKPATKSIAKQEAPQPSTEPRPLESFIIEGNLSTGGEPWAANSIIVRILWLKNKDDGMRLGQEIARLRQNDNGLRYQLRLRHQPSSLKNWNNGVEGNIGRIIAYLDLERDGRLSIKKDRIIAVSKEMVRYRTGRYDENILNETQQENIKKEGKGYAIIHQVRIDEEKTDWQVAYRNSPALVNLSATEKILPNLYTKLIKHQVK